MAETAARLVDETLPEAPVRQWVLTVPHALRFLMAYDREWIAAVHHVFLNAVFASLRRRTGLSSLGRNAKGGTVTFVQRFNMIRYSGVLAPAASWRDRLAPCVESMEDEPEAENAAECPDTAPDLANLPDRPTDVGIGPVSPAPVLAHPQTSADPCPAQTSSGAAGGAGCPQPARGDTEDTRLPGDADPRPADGPRADRMG